jgi:hypothetical protein
LLGGNWKNRAESDGSGLGLTVKGMFQTKLQTKVQTKLRILFQEVVGTGKEASFGPGAVWSQVCAFARRILRLGRRAPRRLRLCESLPLGERRFVAVVEFEHSRFLLGGTAASLVLLARLEEARNAPAHDESAGQSIPVSSCISQAATPEGSC